MNSTARPAMVTVYTAPEGEHEQRVQAWLIEYASQEQPGMTALAVIREPRAAWVYSRPVDAMTALTDEIKPPANADGFVFIFVPSGSATAYEVQKQAERWMSSRAGEQDGIVEILFRSERLLWRRGRALCFGTSQMINDVLAAVARFSLCEGDLERLERQANEACATTEKDKHLTDDPRPWTLKRRPHVDAMVRTAVEMQLAFLRIEKSLEAPPGEISGPVRRLFVELNLLAATEDRLLRLEEVIDVVLEQYQFISERFSDYRYFVREYFLILLIVLFVFGQFLVESEQFWRSGLHYLVGSLPPSTAGP